LVAFTAAAITQATASPARLNVAAYEDVTVAAVGDIACDPDVNGACGHTKTAALIANQDADAVVPLGDVQYETGDYGDYLASYHQTWGQFRPYTYPVIGNHEYYTPDAAGYYRYFADQTKAPGYYAFNLNGWRFYALNSECGRIDCDQQLAWMRADVAANPKRCQAILMHQPRFSSGQHGSSTRVRPFWKIAYANHFELALAGHDHDYERFAKMDPSGEVRSGAGIRSFVVGTGGKNQYAFGDVVPGSLFRYNASPGVLFLDIRPGSYDWRYLAASGTRIDGGSDTCA
jgi:hypothetical protein